MREKIILVIDDDEMNLQIAKMILERKLPCKVLVADNGVDGIDFLKKQRVNLVLLDVMMPDFDGIETLQEIRGDEQIKNVPVMMLTASGDIETIKKAGLLGVKDYIKKPFLPTNLVERVKKKLAEVHAEEILLLGDDEKKLQALQKIIEENFSHETLTATSTSAAEKILRESDINLIIACADMKFVDGFKFLSLIASEEKFNCIPFTITTPEKIAELIEKINTPAVEEKPKVAKSSEVVKPPEVAKPPKDSKPTSPEPKVSKTPIVEEVADSVVARSDKKKIANVVTNFIGYQLNVKV